MSYEYITRTGVIVPDTSDTLAQVSQEWKDSLGRQDLVTTPDTPQGVMITQETISRQSVAENNAQLANQINPNESSGVFLDAICAFTGLERRKASRTLVRSVTLTGIPETLIPSGTRAKTNAEDIFYLEHGVILDSTGTASGDFLSVETGPVPCPAGELINIVDSILGFETVNNTASGVLGEAEESDDQLFMRRNVTLARQGISTVEAQISGLYDLPGVRSLQYRENVTSDTQEIDGITMLPHSVWACVDGGTDTDIAKSLLNNKTDGAGWNGAVEVDVIQEHSGQTYAVLFDRPTEKPLIARITVRHETSIDPQESVRDAIVEYANGQMPKERGLMVGVNVSPFEFSGAINHYYPVLHVSKVEIAFVGDDYQTDELPIALNEKATITGSSITVLVQ
jgi:hypothetical protein